MSLKDSFGPSGGILYHLSALRHRKRNWSDFIDQLHEFLMMWPQKNETLTIFAASGGYCLKPEFLARYKYIRAIDPDPLARTIFQWRNKMQVPWTSENLFIPHGLAGLSTLERTCQNSDLLFSNFYGQLPLLLKMQTTDFENLKLLTQNLFSAVNCCSFHDIYSTDKNIELSNHELNADSFKIEQIKQSTVFVDHLTQPIFSFATNKKRFLWHLRPQQTQIIEAVF